MHKLLEDYVSQVTRTTTATARPAEREADAHELRQHLDEIMLGHQELGLDAEDAARAAIAQFGQAKVVRRELKRVSVRGVFRDRSFWQAAAVATLVQVALNGAGTRVLGRHGTVDGDAFVQLYSGHVDFVFACAWLVQLIGVGKITARLCPRSAPLAASLYGIYQAIVYFVTIMVIAANLPGVHLSDFFTVSSIGSLIVFCLIVAGPPAIYALFAWGFARRQLVTLVREALLYLPVFALRGKDGSRLGLDLQKNGGIKGILTMQIVAHVRHPNFATTQGGIDDLDQDDTAFAGR